MTLMSSPAPDRFLRLAEVRAILQVSRPTLYRLTHDRGLRVVRCGGVVRVAESELRRWLAANTAGAGNQPTDPEARS